MTSPRELRRRIKSISGTAQITKAMQMVAASKMRKAQQAAIAAAAVRAAALPHPAQRDDARPIDFTHPLLEVREVRKRAVILVAADKGLCGALNTNVFRLAAQFDPRVDASSSPPAARRRSSSRARGAQLAAEFAYGDTPTFAEARAIAAFARDLFLKRRGRRSA